MSQEIRRSCIDCAVTRCDNHTSTRPTPPSASASR